MPAHVPIPAAAFAQRPHAYAVQGEKTHASVKRQHQRPRAGRGLELALPLGPALGSPVWHGVSGSPRELNCVERSLQRDLPSAPHSQPESGESTTAVKTQQGR